MNLKRAIAGSLLSFVFLSVFVCMISGVRWVFENSTQNPNKNVFLGSMSDGLQENATENIGEDIVQPVGGPEINAKSAISVESNLQRPGAPSGSYFDKILYEKDSDTPLPIASLTKLMTAVIVLDNYEPSDVIEVSKIADSQDSMNQDVKLGDIMAVEKLLDIMLVGSSNKSAYALSELIGEQKFVGLMNQKADDLGLRNTFFDDPTGLSPKNISTANDLVKLTEHILNNYPKISDISRLKESYVPGFGKVTNTNQLLGEIPDIVCSKTGFTAAAKGCLLLVTNNLQNNNYLINVILGADDRFLEMKKMVNWSSATCN